MPMDSDEVVTSAQGQGHSKKKERLYLLSFSLCGK